MLFNNNKVLKILILLIWMSKLWKISMKCWIININQNNLCLLKTLNSNIGKTNILNNSIWKLYKKKTKLIIWNRTISQSSKYLKFLT